ncbi:MAG: glycerate kinase [Merismopedia sp. SIO2A8]|nr:glycerate kinase [Merismopedia sp. SIO2A8]
MITNALGNCVTGQRCTTEDIQALQQQMTVDDQCCRAFGIIDAETLVAAINQRWSLLQQIYPQLQQVCCEDLGWDEVPLDTAWTLWIPLAMQLSQSQKALGRPFVQGVLGGQGTGKTTLGLVLSIILHHLGQTVCSISIDDIYKTYADRCVLQKNDPRLIWRGPPGTHDVALGLEVLRGVKYADASTAVKVPRFDKSAWNGAGDRTDPETIMGATIVWFEGWFVGARPVDSALFDLAPEPIVTESDRTFARDTNERLKEYLPLWDELDELIVLYPTDYRLSQQWRREAEQKMKALGRDGMSDDEINKFVTYFWRSLHPDLFIKPLLKNANYVDLVVEIDRNHCPCAIYAPIALP